MHRASRHGDHRRHFGEGGVIPPAHGRRATILHGVANPKGGSAHRSKVDLRGASPGGAQSSGDEYIEEEEDARTTHRPKNNDEQG